MYIFGIGMLISFLSLAAAAVVLFSAERTRPDEATQSAQPTNWHTPH
ncbi:hypothetical protein APY03_4996 [Variovorax sp. WDL1]|nr:hypothetical protein APY03_4996 [Variovorax sp. WDL1]